MPPRRKPRWVGCEPPVGAFLPAGGPPAGRGRVELTVDEWESLRLADALGLEQEEAAARMGVSRSTFQRLLSAARQKVARALAGGWVITVGGGSYRLGAATPPEGGERMRHGCGPFGGGYGPHGPHGHAARGAGAEGGHGPAWGGGHADRGGATAGPPGWQEREHLERMATHLEERLRRVRQRLEELGGEPGQEPRA